MEIEILQIRHKITSDVYVLKKIQKSRNYEMINAIIKELKLLRDLDHPNIIKLYAFKETDN
jgi:serine/threonine protein kinase